MNSPKVTISRNAAVAVLVIGLVAAFAFGYVIGNAGNEGNPIGGNNSDAENARLPEAANVAVQNAIAHEIRFKSGYNGDGVHNIASVQKAPYPQNLSRFDRFDEVWCVVIDPPIAGDFYPSANFVMTRKGALWEKYFSETEEDFLSVGCTIWRDPENRG